MTPTGKPMALTAQAALAHYSTQARIAELEAEVERLKPDAERYRYIRQFYVDVGPIPDRVVKVIYPPNGQAWTRLGGIKGDLDATIDAFLATSKGA